MQKLMLLDAYALIFRAYYGLIRSPRINSKGENTSAVFGFVNTLEELLRTEQPDFLAVAFDPPGGTFRHEAFADYKAQREETPAGIKWAVPVIKDILEAYGIVACEVKGFEADDVIGTLALQGQAAGLDVLMVTPDKDYAQLVRPGITMCRPSSGKSGLEKLDVEAVCEKYGLAHPTQVIDMLALMGDAADNIPGCPGVGPKTAIKLLAEFENVEQLIENVDQLKGSLRQKVSDHVEDIRNSKFLATIVTDVPIELDLDAMKRREPNKEKLKNIFEACEFRTFIQRFLGESPNAKTNAVEEPDLFAPQGAENGAESGNLSTNYPQSSHKTLQDTEHNYVLIDNLKDASALCGNLLTFPIVAFDTETTGIDAMSAEMVGMSFAVEGGRAWYVAVPENKAEAQEFVDAFRPFFENEGQIKVGQNLKYDLTILSHYGVEVKGELFDTMLAHYVVEPEQRHNMDYLAETYLHYRTIHIEELIGTGRQQKNMRDLAPNEICDYACEDADVTLRLYPILREKMAECDVTDVFSKIEMPLMPVLARIEQNGVRLDTEALQQTGDDFRARLQTLEEEVYALAGHEFTITSPKQVGTVLFEELKISEKARKTKTGQYSTSEEVLETLRDKHPIVEKILAHRALKKLLSTYVEALPKLINPRTGRIHTSFNQAVTATGRLSSSNPNLQNIPVRGEDGREIRKAFVPDEDCTFFSADYSQIELRIMAHLSGDEHMIADFNAGHDIHAATAARIFHKSIEEVTRDERRKAKTANFGIIYGISAFGLSERLSIPRKEAKELIDGYFASYPGVASYMERVVAEAKQRGYVTTLLERRRSLPDINSANAVVRGYAERNAINAPLQGSAADLIKLAMIHLDAAIRERGLKSRMILQVHDELNFNVPMDELAEMTELVRSTMESVFPDLRVPLEVSIGHGTNWLEAH